MSHEGIDLTRLLLAVWDDMRRGKALVQRVSTKSSAGIDVGPMLLLAETHYT